MINYIKTHKLTAEQFIELNKIVWNDEKYMKPFDEAIQWLTFGKLTITFGC